MTLRKYYRPDEVRTILSISKSTLEKELGDGKLAFIWVRGQRRIAVTELERYEKDNAGDPLDVRRLNE